jgi:myo-inositol 2-dehydrogenase/D-chiro-inositol 1-dehydrogenase
MGGSAKVRFGLIGYGAWGSFHAQAIAKTPGAELVAIAAKSEKTTRAAREAFPTATVYDDYRTLLKEADVELVDVVLPSYLHFEVGRAVLESGRHLLMEKPLALSVDDCRTLIDTARQRGKLLAVGHELRVSSLWGHVKQLIDGGRIGKPQYVLIELSRRPYRQGADGWRYDIERVGNWILEEPIHFFDLARWYLAGSGTPTSVYARANSKQADHPELQDNFSAIVSFPDGAYAAVTQTLAAFEHHQTVKVSGTKGALWATWSGALDRTLHPTFGLRWFDGEQIRDVTFEKMTGEVFELEDELAMVTAAVRGEGSVAASGDDGKWSVGLCLAAQESVQKQASVSLAHLLR